MESQILKTCRYEGAEGGGGGGGGGKLEGFFFLYSGPSKKRLMLHWRLVYISKMEAHTMFKALSTG